MYIDKRESFRYTSEAKGSPEAAEDAFEHHTEPAMTGKNQSVWSIPNAPCRTPALIGGPSKELIRLRVPPCFSLVQSLFRGPFFLLTSFALFGTLLIRFIAYKSVFSLGV